MQISFDFGAGAEMTWARDRLKSYFGRPSPNCTRSPIGQLVKSSISGRTRDEVSLAAYHRLVETYAEWSAITAAPLNGIQATINDVTFPDVKAQHLRDALRIISTSHPDFDLAFLGRLGVEPALAWLERLPGVGRKVAASTLNFSTLRMPAFVVDTHILRVLGRFGFIRHKADTEAAYEMVMEVLDTWTATDLAELHMLIKQLGQNICRLNNPCCSDCPIRLRCQAGAAYLKIGAKDELAPDYGLHSA